MHRDITQQVSEFLPHLVQSSESPFDAMMLAVVAAVAMAKAAAKPRAAVHEAVDRLWQRVDADPVVAASGPRPGTGRPD